MIPLQLFFQVLFIHVTFIGGLFLLISLEVLLLGRRFLISGIGLVFVNGTVEILKLVVIGMRLMYSLRNSYITRSYRSAAKPILKALIFLAFLSPLFFKPRQLPGLALQKKFFVRSIVVQRQADETRQLRQPHLLFLSSFPISIVHEGIASHEQVQLLVLLLLFRYHS